MVRGLEVEDTTLICADGEVQAKRLGTTRVIDVDTVIFCIGDKVDESFGLPVRWNAFVKHAEPRFPVDGLSYEAFTRIWAARWTGFSWLAGHAKPAAAWSVWPEKMGRTAPGSFGIPGGAARAGRAAACVGRFTGSFAAHG